MDDKDNSEKMITKGRTQYDASVWEIFWRNFVAGSSRTMGSIFVYIVIVLFGSFIFYQIVWPQLVPVISGLTKTLESVGKVPSFQLPGGFSFPQSGLDAR